MFNFTSYFLFSGNKNTENKFSKGNIFLDLLKITFLSLCFYFIQHEVLISNENIKTRFYCFLFWFVFLKSQSNVFS